ncbi:hypothetical protein SLE2022_320930 [Rubroshorea leprosula]
MLLGAAILSVATNVRVLIILSLSLQAFLILFARLRKEATGRKGTFIRWLIWLAYLLSDKVAAQTMVLIFSRKCRTSTSTGLPTDILLFWASFLFLHVGGPDNITSYAQEDNELWKRRLLWLLLRLFLSLDAFSNSFSKNKLRLPTILVLFAGITKCAERNFALYRASFGHLGMYWGSFNVNMEADEEEDKMVVDERKNESSISFKTGADERKTESSISSKPESSISSKTGDDEKRGKMGTGSRSPVQFQGLRHESTLGAAVRLRTAVGLFDNLKRALVGPLLTKGEKEIIRDNFQKIKRSKEALRVLKIELSLLYELLHTKLPVIDTTSGFCLRMANYGCILLALVLFSLAKRHYQLGEFDMLLTYGLLIGALALDFLSIRLLFKHSDWVAISHFQESNEGKVIARQDRWSNEVPQLNFITYHVKDMPVWLNKLVYIRELSGLVKKIKGIRCQSSHSMDKEHDRFWSFIYHVVNKFSEDTEINEVWLGKGRKILDDKQQKIIDNLDYTSILLVWHIVTELCYQEDDQYKPERNTDYRQICKVLSDYMFYLAMMEPAMMVTVLDNWNTVYRCTLREIRRVVPWSFSSDEKAASERILDKGKENGKILFSAVQLALQLKRQNNQKRWQVMGKIWVELMCHAAINCRPNVHAKQPSKGGELLTLVWLLMNHLGLGTKNRATLKDVMEDETESDDDEGA